MPETIQEKMDSIINQLQEAKEEEAMGFEHQTYKTLIEFGKYITPLAKEFQTKENMIDKCTSTVYLLSSIEDGKMHFQGETDAQFVKGELGILMYIYEGITPEELNADSASKQFMSFFSQLQELVPISMNRKRGFVSIFERMRHSSKIKQKIIK